MCTDRKIKGWFTSDILYLECVRYDKHTDGLTKYTQFSSSGTSQLTFSKTEQDWLEGGFTPIYEDEEVKITL